MCKFIKWKGILSIMIKKREKNEQTINNDNLTLTITALAY